MTARLKSDAFAVSCFFVSVNEFVVGPVKKKKERKGPVPDTRGSEMLNVSFFLFSMSSVDKLQRGGVCVCVAMW